MKDKFDTLIYYTQTTHVKGDDPHTQLKLELKWKGTGIISKKHTLTQILILYIFVIKKHILDLKRNSDF
jgi:hypothetical protein